MMKKEKFIGLFIILFVVFILGMSRSVLGTDVDKIDITVQTPVAGEIINTTNGAVYDVRANDGAVRLEVEEIKWYKTTDTGNEEITGNNNEFNANDRYAISIKLIAPDGDVAAAYDDIVLKINGKEIEKNQSNFILGESNYNQAFLIEYYLFEDTITPKEISRIDFTFPEPILGQTPCADLSKYEIKINGEKILNKDIVLWDYYEGEEKKFMWDSGVGATEKTFQENVNYTVNAGCMLDYPYIYSSSVEYYINGKKYLTTAFNDESNRSGEIMDGMINLVGYDMLLVNSDKLIPKKEISKIDVKFPGLVLGELLPEDLTKYEIKLNGEEESLNSENVLIEWYEAKIDEDEYKLISNEEVKIGYKYYFIISLLKDNLKLSSDLMYTVNDNTLDGIVPSYHQNKILILPSKVYTMTIEEAVEETAEEKNEKPEEKNEIEKKEKYKNPKTGNTIKTSIFTLIISAMGIIFIINRTRKQNK